MPLAAVVQQGSSQAVEVTPPDPAVTPDSGDINRDMHKDDMRDKNKGADENHIERPPDAIIR